MTRPAPRARALRATLLVTSLLAAWLLTPGCGGSPGTCDPEVVPLPAHGAWWISDITVTDEYDGGDSEEWDWSQRSPWGDVKDGEVRMEGGRLFVQYTTEHGTFLVAFEATDTDGF